MADRYYVVDSYWTADYVGYQADAAVSATPYFEDGYYTPEDYYENNGSFATLTVSAVRIRTIDSGAISISDAFTPTMTVNAVRNTFAVLDSVSSVTAQGAITSTRSLSVTAEFNQVADNVRTRSNTATLSVIASCEGFATIIVPQGELQEAHAHLQSNITANITVNAVRTDELDFYVVVNMTPDGVERVRGGLATIATDIDVTTINARTRNDSATVNAEFAQTASAGRIQGAEVLCGALFTPSMTVNAVRNTFAVLDSISALTGVVNANRSADIALASIINLSSQGDKVVDYVANITSAFAQTANNTRTRNLSVDITGQFQQTVVVARTRNYDAQLSTTTSVTASVERLRAVSASISAQINTTFTVNEVVQLDSTISAASTLTASVGNAKQFAADLGALFTPTMTVNAQRNTFAVLDAVSTVNAQAVKTTRTSTNITAQFSLSAVEQKVKNATVFSKIGGVNIQNRNAIILVDNQLTTSQTPTETSKFAISFWAYNPLGVLLDTSPLGLVNQIVYDWGGFFEFTNDNKLKFQSYLNDRISPDSYSEVTWTLPSNNDWHHYLIDYQVTPTGDQTPTTVKRSLYVDGQLVSAPTVSRVRVPGGGAPGPDTIALYNGQFITGGQYYPQLMWALGGEIVNYNPAGYDKNSLISTSERYYTGAVTQLAVWYDANTPDFTQSQQRQKLYDNGYIPLGIDGTLSGLARPNIYLRLDSAGDIAQRGVNGLNTFWYYDSVVGGTEYLVPYTYNPVDDSVNRNSIITASVQISARSSNSGFTDCELATSLACEALKLQPGQTALISDTQLQAVNNKITGYSSNLTVHTQQTTDEVVTRSAISSITSSFTATIDADRLAGLSSQNTVQATVTADISNSRVRPADAAISADANLSATALKIKQLSATIQVEGFVQQVTSKIGSLIVLMESQFQIQAQPISTASAELDLYCQTVQFTEPVKTVTTVKSVTMSAQQQASAQRIRSTSSSNSIDSTVSAVTGGAKIVGASANLTSNFAQTTQTTRVRNPQTVTANLQFTQTLTVDLFKTYTANCATVIAQTAQAVKTVRPQTVFQAIATNITVGQAISYDRNLTLYIKREYRQLIIPEESTLLKVHEETRVNMVRT